MSEPSTTYTAHDVPDLLAALPTMFGFTPEESFVAIATSGPRRRLGFRMRHDIPAPEGVGSSAALILRHLHHQPADGVILLAVTEQVEVAAALMHRVVVGLDPRIQPVVVAWADGDRYWEPGPDCPREGIAYRSSRHHLSVVAAIAAGQEILPDRQALVDRFAACDGEVFDRMVAVTERVMADDLPLVGDDPDLVSAALPLIDPVVAHALDRADRLSDVDCARLGLWVSSIVVRDELWGRIDHDGARDWLRIWTDVAGRVVPPFEPAVLCLASFSAWLVGDGAQALIAAERALEADPEYSMAGLMIDLLQGGVPPSAWTGWS
ncbi:hypothetical protein HMPREF0063_10921 [Aeromicrobium marinum DSM 15272]|uniref:DUF4192 domain-containing protein n=1 Tax=Aeromicrobium marinum DSM 15272 TaxID=585531 RepID=E2SAD1_9ACTN|nr:DUF4192 domain-containing protein [Aeromicrobium marinum]EFQ84205.1 hypothetical protein HMPREF0063_10921 [Aeromicrobium marinum DSM 15272]